MMKTISLTRKESDALSQGAEQVRALIESCGSEDTARELDEIVQGLESIQARALIYRREPKQSEHTTLKE